LRKGFVLLIVIMILGLMGAEFFVMTGISNRIGFQTNRALLEAVRQNMTSSAIAWAKYNVKNGNIKKTGEKIQLDTAGLCTRNSQLNITIEKITHKEVEVSVNTFCTFGGQSLKNSKKYVVSRRQ